MKEQFARCMVRFHREEAGQGLVEYVLLMGLIGFSATAGMSSLASGISSGFTKVDTFLKQAIS
jgi:pilus assembly protein Flp/PilA